jgi:DNA-binding transcriptional MocR family regulator
MPKGRYKQLVDGFADQIHSGKLPAGTRLPTHRQLASIEHIALATASRVYAELEIMGLVSGEIGRGTFVREAGLPLGYGVDQTTTPADMIDLNFNYPSLPGQADLLRESFRRLSSSGDLESLLRYQPHAGRPNERAIIAKHLQCRDLHIEPNQVSIVSGAQHGLTVALMSLLKPGDIMVVDALTYPGLKSLAEAHRIEIASIPSLDTGPDLQAFKDLCKKRPVKAVYAMPTLHNPLGWVLSLEQREELVVICRKYNVIVIEDGAYAFLAENPPPPIATLAPELTVYISGFSKNIATGLRVGYIVAPALWEAKIERSIRVTTWNTPALLTGMVCNWIEDGTVLRLEAEKRADAVARQAIARGALKGLNYIGHPASYFLWLPLGEEARADKVVMELMDANITVAIAEAFSTTVHTPHALRLALGSVSLDVLKTALFKVKSVVDYHSL